MKIRGHRFICEKPLFVYFKKHYCPNCEQILVRKKVSKIVHSDSEEAKNYDFNVCEIDVKGYMKFTHIDFFCPSCQKQYTVKEIKNASTSKKRFKDFKSSLEFLTSYGFEYCYDSATGKRECYKNRFGEIILDHKQLDPNCWIPQICIEINYRKQIINVEQEYFLLHNKKSKNLFDMLHIIAKNKIATRGKLFDILIEPKYLID